MNATKSRLRSFGSILLAINLIAPLAAAPWLRADEGITGDWELKMDFLGRETFGSLSITKKADGSLAGKWGSTELTDVKFEGDKLSFVRTLKFGDQEFKSTYEGTLKGGDLTGKMTGQQRSFDVAGSRRKPRSPALGRWSLKYHIADRDVEATLAVAAAADGSLDGKWTSSTGEHTVSGLKFQEGKLTLSRKSKIGEREFESTLEGTIQGNKLTGTIKTAMGEVPASGERAGGNLIGKWELASTSDRGPRTNTLTIFADLTGRYEMFGGELPIKDLKLEGDQVAFVVEAGSGDQAFKIDAKGKLEGGALKGETTSARGTREFTGKRVDDFSGDGSNAGSGGRAALVGTWEITRESQQGPRTSTLTIKEDLSGTYTIRDTTAAITDLKVDGAQVAFKVTVKYGDREVPQEFKGKLEGAVLKGTFTTPRGAREATGKKVKTTTSL